MKIEGDFRFIPLGNGGCAIVDSDKYESIKNMRWVWCHRGVGCNDKDQLILLHSMIAPFERVSFKNGFKWDCRKDNLFRTEGPRGLGVNIYDHKKAKAYQIHRKAIFHGQEYCFCHKVYYGQKRSKEAAFLKATEIRNEICSKNRDEFVQYMKERPLKRLKGNDILKDWDCWKDRENEISIVEMYQMNITHRYDPNLRK